MTPKRPSSKKTKVRRTVVNLALKEMLLALDPLDSQASLEQQVLVSSRVSPESFDGLTNKGDGAVLLRFVRPYEFSAWQLDENQFLIIEDE